jgi:integrase
MATILELPLPEKRRGARRWPSTNLTVDALRAMDRTPGARIYSSDLPGFYALRQKSGAVTFYVQADTPTHTRERLPKTMTRVIGEWGEKFSPKAARKVAGEYIAAIKSGEDPDPAIRRGEPEEAKPVTWTLEMAFGQYMKKVERDGGSPGTVTIYNDSFKRVPDRMRKRLLVDVILDEHGDLPALHETILKNVAHARGRNRNEDSGKNSADATLKLIGRVARYSWGRSRQIPTWNSGVVDYHPPRPRHANGMGLGDLAAWWSDVKKLRNPIRRELGLFMLLTGLRSNDARTASIVNLNETDKTIFIPAPKGENKKKGRRRAFTLVLSDAALGCCRRARAANTQPTDLLFPNPQGASFDDANLGTAKRKGHDLRHTFETIAEDLGVEEIVIARMLNHKPKSQTAAYGNPDHIVKSPREAIAKINGAMMERIKL